MTIEKHCKFDFNDGLKFQNLVSEESIKLCKEYSEDETLFNDFIENHKITARYQGISKWNNSENETMKIAVRIENKNGNSCEFDFHMSVMDTATVNFNNCGITALKQKYYRILYPYSKYSWSQSTMEERRKIKSDLNKKVKKVKNDMLYSVLCSVGMDYHYSEYSHKEFCQEFGYDEDSLKILNLYNECKELSYRLKDVIHPEYIDSMPR